jgi:hypothetical protein
MTYAQTAGSPAPMVRCPICLDTFSWPANGVLYRFKGLEIEELDLPPDLDQRKRVDIERTAFLRCPNPSGDGGVHFLPAAYGSYETPLVIGLVGETQSGKSHLLAAMIAAIEAGELMKYGLVCRPVDFVLHDNYLETRARPFTQDGSKLEPTREGLITYADALLITTPAGKTWPVAFFDVAGGDLRQVGQPARFIAGAGGLIFVVNPSDALRMSTDEDPPRKLGRATPQSDDAFATVLGRLGGGERYLDVPAAIVLNKSDRLRFMPPVDVWLRRQGDGRLDAAQLRAESRDAYAFLYQHGAKAWLRPFHECRRCTLHFVSATGAELIGGGYPRGVRPMRVLEPLVALLAMAGVITGGDSESVGKR